MSVKIYNILIAEDQVYIRKIIQHNFERKKLFKITPVSNGNSAMNFIKGNETFDLFLLDIMMPDMTGIELCKEIRKIDKYKNTPIVMLTALSTRQKVVEAISAGANDYVTKPFKMDVLIGKVCDKLGIKLPKKHENTN